MLALNKRLKITALITVSSLFVACGGGGGDGAGAGAGGAASTFLMGGSIQGEALSLTTVVTTLAGGGPGSNDGIGTAAHFLHPSGITTDGTRLYVADTVNHTIRQIVIATGAVTTLAGSAGLAGSDNGTGSAARFNNPFGITTDGTRLYVADTDNHTVRQIVIATGEVTTLAGSAGLTGSDNGIGSVARFNNPHGITTDGIDLYVADRSNGAIRQIDIATGEVTTLPNGISNLLGITTDGTNLYVTTDFAILQVVIATGTVTTLAGDQTGSTTGSTDGIGSVARFNEPRAITTDGASLYVTDTGNQTIRKIVIATGEVTTLAGTAGVGGTADGTGGAAQFGSPRGVTTDGVSLYVQEFYGTLGTRQID